MNITINKNDLYSVGTYVLNKYYTTDAEALPIEVISSARRLVRAVLDSDNSDSIILTTDANIFCNDRKVDNVCNAKNAEAVIDNHIAKLLVNAGITPDLYSNKSIDKSGIHSEMFNCYSNALNNVLHKYLPENILSADTNADDYISYSTYIDLDDFELKVFRESCDGTTVTNVLLIEDKKNIINNDGLTILFYPLRKELYMSEENGFNYFSIYYPSTDEMFEQFAEVMAKVLKKREILVRSTEDDMNHYSYAYVIEESLSTLSKLFVLHYCDKLGEQPKTEVEL